MNCMGPPPQFTLPGTAYTRCVSIIPQGGVYWKVTPPGLRGPVGALSEAREYEDRCVHSTALGSILKGSMGCIPVGYTLGRRATTMHCTGKHHALP